jgi:transposase
MGKPYSLDLRKRVVDAIEGGMSRNRAAKQFGVAISTAIGWMQRVEETGRAATSRRDFGRSCGLAVAADRRRQTIRSLNQFVCRYEERLRDY